MSNSEEMALSQQVERLSGDITENIEHSPKGLKRADKDVIY